ncbi:MAG: LptF/LptG family permease, partial [Thiovulaceae bacterium]|nr:LptF/LptG family permease [Sulfurimonadaceae bacterium]
MSSSLFQYIAMKYLKIFLIIFASLILFYVGFDYLSQAKRLPDSANLRMLYVYYHVMFASDILLPLALIFSMIAVKLFLIRSNELVAIYSLGYSKAQVLRPFLIVSLVITFIYIGVHATKYSYAEEYVRSIADHGKLQRATR